MNIFYVIALLLIPFDNIVVAPSAGWAALSPLFFSIYVLTNARILMQALKLEFKKIGYLYFTIIYSLVLFIFYGLNVSNFLDAIITLTLGLGFYFALIIRYQFYKKDILKDISLLVFSYSLSLIYGVIKYISLELNISPVLSLFGLIEKRYYGRVAFSFTEPSFIPMHVFGVLLLILLFIDDTKLKKRIALLIGMFSIVTIISASSSRFFTDLGVILLLLSIYFIVSLNVKLFTKIISVALLVIAAYSFTLIIEDNPRMQSIVDDGVYADPSLASRYFRINASMKGYEELPVKAVFGAGVGNSFYFFQHGYEPAFSEYKNDYKGEVLSLKDVEVGQLFSFPMRIISEIGMINLMIITLYLLALTRFQSKNVLAVFIVFWLYMQFDSYAFYTLWLIIFILIYKDKLGNSVGKEELQRLHLS